MPPSAKKKPASTTKGTAKGKQRNEKLIAVVEGAQVGITWVDKPQNISEGLVDTITFKANCIECFYRTPDGSEESYYGQAGLIRGERLPPTPAHASKGRRLNDGARQPLPLSSCWTVTPASALHNITNDLNDNGVAIQYQSTKIYTSTRPSKTLNIVFNDGDRILGPDDKFTLHDATEDEEAITWESQDKTLGVSISDASNFLTQKPLSFVKVPDNFVLEVDQMIGMAVYRTFDLLPEDAVAPAGTDMEKVYGPKQNTCIYTGKITEVHGRKLSFEHSINTFCGCSGAVIFLLDTNQVASARDHIGKAVGIHVGGHPDDFTRANVAFRV